MSLVRRSLDEEICKTKVMSQLDFQSVKGNRTIFIRMYLRKIKFNYNQLMQNWNSSYFTDFMAIRSK